MGGGGGGVREEVGMAPLKNEKFDTVLGIH